MNLYLVDDTKENVDPEFDAALFVRAETPQRAAFLWENAYGRGATVARVTKAPHMPMKCQATEGHVDWDDITTTIVTL